MDTCGLKEGKMSKEVEYYVMRQIRGLPAFKYERFVNLAMLVLKIGAVLIGVCYFVPLNDVREELFQYLWVPLIPMGVSYSGLLLFWQRISKERRNGYCTVFVNERLSLAAMKSFIYVDGLTSALIARADESINTKGDFNSVKMATLNNFGQCPNPQLVELPRYRVPFWEWESIWTGAVEPLYETNLEQGVSVNSVEFLKSFTATTSRNEKPR